MAERDIGYVLASLESMRSERASGPTVWGTCAFGLVLYVSLYRETGEERWLYGAKSLVAEIDRVLGRRCGYRRPAIHARQSDSLLLPNSLAWLGGPQRKRAMADDDTGTTV